MGITETTQPDDPRRVLLDEHDHLVTLVMAYDDMIRDGRNDIRTFDRDQLRKATADTLRQSIATTEICLLELGLDRRPRPRSARYTGLPEDTEAMPIGQVERALDELEAEGTS